MEAAVSHRLYAKYKFALCSHMTIARRTLRIIGNEHNLEVPITIHMPVEVDRCWACDYEIGWPSKPLTSRALGIDGVQALQLAMFSIGTELWANPYHHAGLLIFEEEGPSYGFPAEFPREVGREDH
jgi:hypothetical protein